MNVREVKQTVKGWLEANISQFLGLRGAHFVGSITTMPEEVAFPTYKDIDFHLILEENSPLLESQGPFPNILETEYHGLILEGGYKPVSEYASLQAVLSNAEIAHHLTVDSSFYDPGGLLRDLQAQIQQEYPRRKWVLARVDYERKGLAMWQGLRQMAQSMDRSGAMEVNLLGYHFTYITALLCMASLQAPSSAYSRLHDILAEYGRLDLYKETLDILGVSNIQPGQLEQLLQEGAQAFDLAVRIRRTPHPFQHKLHPHQRRYFVDKCHSLIDAGQSDEAATWLLPFYLSSAGVILADGPDEIKPEFASRLDHLIAILGMDTPQRRDDRFLRTSRLDEEFFSLADQIISRHPRIFD